MALRVFCSVLKAEPPLFALLSPGCVSTLLHPPGESHCVWLQKDTCIRVRLTQSRLEMALSSVNPPSSYRLKQRGDIVEDWRSSLLGCPHHSVPGSSQSKACMCSHSRAMILPQQSAFSLATAGIPARAWQGFLP